ncbi:MAG TPA: hypothetical protein VFZ81_07900, partial [Burkholderiales bacterium]
WRLFAHLPRRERLVFACLSAALGAATSVFWMTVGSSFLDPLLVIPMLAGLLLLVDDGRSPGRRAFLAGALFGIAAALKYSNAIFAVAALPLAAAMPGAYGMGRLRPALAYMAGGALAVALFAGPWLALMAREFGNPVFPLMNGWFQSPHALPVNLVARRFIPEDLGAALAFPFRMLASDRAVYSEVFAPDIRFAALLAAALAVPVLRVRRSASAHAALRGIDWRVLAFLAAGLVLWLATSANARYGLVLLLLGGVCLARLAERVLPARACRIGLAVLLVVQLTMLVMSSPSRWMPEPWTRQWLAYAVPPRALQVPSLYLTVEVLSMSALTPLVHPASSFVNFRGQHSLPTDSLRLGALLERHRGRVRTLGRGLELVDGKPRPEALQSYDATLLRIGYRVNADDCFTIPWERDDGDRLSRAVNWLARLEPSPEELSVVSCALLPVSRDAEDIAAEQAMSSLFDRMEKACPEVFRGQTAVTERLGSGWSRNYAGLDARLEVHAGTVILNRYRSAIYLHLGALSDWKGAQPPSIPGCTGG